MFAVSGLAKAYGGQTLFEDVSLQFNAGERYGVVGANGSGKSTFLRILAGDDIPSEGAVAIPKRRASACCARTTSSTRTCPSSTSR